MMIAGTVLLFFVPATIHMKKSNGKGAQRGREYIREEGAYHLGKWEVVMNEF